MDGTNEIALKFILIYNLIMLKPKRSIQQQYVFYEPYYKHFFLNAKCRLTKAIYALRKAELRIYLLSSTQI